MTVFLLTVIVNLRFILFTDIIPIYEGFVKSGGKDSAEFFRNSRLLEDNCKTSPKKLLYPLAKAGENMVYYEYETENAGAATPPVKTARRGENPYRLAIGLRRAAERRLPGNGASPWQRGFHDQKHALSE